MNNSISREQLKQKMDAGEPLTLVEALPERYFEAEHLPGAINLPHTEVRTRAAEVLPNKDAFIVVYCSNTACQNSNMAAQTLVQMGYTNAHEYVEGKQHWMEANYPVETGL